MCKDLPIHKPPENKDVTQVPLVLALLREDGVAEVCTELPPRRGGTRLVEVQVGQCGVVLWAAAVARASMGLAHPRAPAEESKCGEDRVVVPAGSSALSQPLSFILKSFIYNSISQMILLYY